MYNWQSCQVNRRSYKPVRMSAWAANGQQSDACMVLEELAIRQERRVSRGLILEPVVRTSYFAPSASVPVHHHLRTLTLRLILAALGGLLPMLSLNGAVYFCGGVFASPGEFTQQEATKCCGERAVLCPLLIYRKLLQLLLPKPASTFWQLLLAVRGLCGSTNT